MSESMPRFESSQFLHPIDLIMNEMERRQYIEHSLASIYRETDQDNDIIFFFEHNWGFVSKK